jgi:tetratricopeptide (TPR) repeat protein
MLPNFLFNGPKLPKRQFAMGSLACLLLWVTTAPVAQTIELNLPDAGRQNVELNRPELKKAQALLDSARTKRQAKDFASALLDTEGALLLQPRDLPGRYLRAILLADLVKIKEAHKAFEELTQEFPELPEPHNNLAVQQASLGQLEPARLSLLRALAIFPDYVVAQENLGDVYIRMAQVAYQAAVKSAGVKPAGSATVPTSASESLKTKLQTTTDWLKK